MPGEEPDASRRNDLSGTVFGPSIQAQAVHGGIQLNAGDRSKLPVPAQLPVPAFLANRRTELEDLGRLVARNAKDNRPGLVVISGVAGVGKTTLGLHWLHRLRAEYEDGQLFADLRGFSGDDRPMPSSEPLEGFLRALGIAAENVPIIPEEQAALFRSLTADRRLIVMLDNAASAAQVRPLLPGAGPSLVVVTTRRRLSGLAVEGARFLELDPLNESGAMELLDRMLGATRVQAEPHDARSLVTLCGHLPLAVCASGARLATRRRWTIARVVQELRDENRRLSALSREDDISVQAVFDLSYRALPDEAARLYRLLSLHPGSSFDAAAVAALAESDPGRAGELLDLLADASLLQEQAGDRYSFHDLLRLHAREKMAEAESEADCEAAFARLADYYLRTAVAADTARQAKRWHLGPHYAQFETAPQEVFTDWKAALVWLETELPTLVAVVEESQRHGLFGVAWQICEPLASLFGIRKHYRLWIKSLRLGLAAARTSGNEKAQARMLEALGVAYLNLKDFPEVIRLSGQALELERRTGHRLGETTALENLGLAELGTGDPNRAANYFDQARRILRELGRPRGVALMSRRIGEAANAAGRPAEAIEMFTAALSFYAQADEPYHEARALNGLADAYLRTGRLAEAEQALRAALTATERVGALHEQASVHVTLARLAALRGEPVAERDHLRQAEAIFIDLGAPQAADITRRLASAFPDPPPDGPGSREPR